MTGWEKLPLPYRSHLGPDARSELDRFPSDWPELEILPLATTSAVTRDTANYAEISIALLTPTSRGNVTINSTSTDTNPAVDPNWLSTAADQELAVGSFRRARQIANATGMIVGPEFDPGPATQTDAQILEFIKRTLITIHHGAGTCK